MDPGSELAYAGDLAFVDAQDRPSVREFFENWGERSCILNGFEVRSITHERCLRLLLTGKGDEGAADWGTLIAAHAGDSPPLPHLVLAGPSYAGSHGQAVVRAGRRGQLSSLVSGDALGISDWPLTRPTSAAQDLEQAFLRQRTAEFLANAASGAPERFGQAYAASLAGMDGLDASVHLTAEPQACNGIHDQLQAALNALESGQSRCVSTQYAGVCAASWDDHADITAQSRHFEELFQHLNALADALSSRPGPAGGSLGDETCVVVLSEMGRHPQRNSFQGKDHWTFTSALVFGSGIRGGQVVGQVDETALGLPIDLASGEPSSSGTALLADHLGATLLALADIDPAEHLDVGPITAIQSSS
jgi:uncharacterized protein (DUF1501 family)